MTKKDIPTKSILEELDSIYSRLSNNVTSLPEIIVTSANNITLSNENPIQEQPDTDHLLPPIDNYRDEVNDLYDHLNNSRIPTTEPIIQLQLPPLGNLHFENQLEDGGSSISR